MKVYPFPYWKIFIILIIYIIYFQDKSCAAVDYKKEFEIFANNVNCEVAKGLLLTGKTQIYLNECNCETAEIDDIITSLKKQTKTEKNIKIANKINIIQEKISKNIKNGNHGEEQTAEQFISSVKDLLRDSIKRKDDESLNYIYSEIDNSQKRFYEKLRKLNRIQSLEAEVEKLKVSLKLNPNIGQSPQDDGDKESRSSWLKVVLISIIGLSIIGLVFFIILKKYGFRKKRYVNKLGKDKRSPEFEEKKVKRDDIDWTGESYSANKLSKKREHLVNDIDIEIDNAISRLERDGKFPSNFAIDCYQKENENWKKQFRQVSLDKRVDKFQLSKHINSTIEAHVNSTYYLLFINLDEYFNEEVTVAHLEDNKQIRAAKKRVSDNDYNLLILREVESLHDLYNTKKFISKKEALVDFDSLVDRISKRLEELNLSMDTILYAPQPSSDGCFLIEKLAEEPKEHHMFRIFVPRNIEDEAYFEFIYENNKAMRTAVLSYTAALEPVCEIIGLVKGGERIISENPGKKGLLRKEMDRWRVVEKLRIKVV